MGTAGEVTVKFADGKSEDLTLQTGECGMLELVEKARPFIRGAKGWPAARYLRLVAAGRELWEDDRIAPGAVLHCVASDHAPPAGRRRPRRDEQPTADWVDSLDPGTCLMWIFGSLLSLFWLMYVFYGDLFDRASIVMLATMTVAFVAPWAASALAWPAAWLWGRPCAPGEQHGARAAERGAPGGRYPGYAIPPRPPALVQPGQP